MSITYASHSKPQPPLVLGVAKATPGPLVALQSIVVVVVLADPARRVLPVVLHQPGEQLGRGRVIPPCMVLHVQLLVRHQVPKEHGQLVSTVELSGVDVAVLGHDLGDVPAVTPVDGHGACHEALVDLLGDPASLLVGALDGQVERMAGDHLHLLIHEVLSVVPVGVLLAFALWDDLRPVVISVGVRQTPAIGGRRNGGDDVSNPLHSHLTLAVTNDDREQSIVSLLQHVMHSARLPLSLLS
mmetsp:Transcript_916/g.3374  ORF Transcript_916/g.3374 Transcript_916/m.3374 type:complete len:242 (+) Transcript_916:1909-2634(+)